MLLAILMLTGQLAAGAETVVGSVSTGAPTLVVFRFKGPAEVSVETSLGYKVKSLQLSNPYSDDFDELGIALQKALVTELKSKLGESAVEREKVARFNNDGSTNDVDDLSAIARKDGAKFMLTGIIDKVRFEGNTLIPNYYEMTVSGKLTSVASGDTVWSIHHHLFASMHGTDDKKEVGELFNELMAPHVARKIAPAIATSLSD